MLSNLKRIKNLPFIFIVFETTFILILIAFILGMGQAITSPILSNIFYGVGASLLSWLFVYIVAINLDRDVIEHHDTTKEILNVVKEKYISLISVERASLNDDDYEKWYEEGHRINISGIALNKLSTYLTSNRGQYLINLIQDQEKTVRILFLHPDSPMVSIRQDIDHKILGDIEYTRASFINLYKSLLKRGKPNGSLCVKMTKKIMYSTIFSVENVTDIKKGVMLLGLIFCHQEGTRSPLYEVPRCHNGHLRHQLYIDCQDNFNNLFNDPSSETIFTWD